MRLIQKTVKIGSKPEQKIYYEQFKNYNEYVSIVEEREKTNAHSKEYDLHNLCKNSSWVGCSSYQEAKNLLLQGWDSKVELLKSSLDKDIADLANKPVSKMFADVQGFMPIVPISVMNLPNCMLNIKRENKSVKVLKFMIIENRKSVYSSEQVIEKMSKILARIYALEKSGYRCRIELFSSHWDIDEGGKTLVCHSVLLKSENQLFDIKRMAFPIAHSGMQRVFSFAWENSLPINYYSYHCSGMGRTCQLWDKASREDLFKALIENNEKIIPVGMETKIDEVFGKVVK